MFLRLNINICIIKEVRRTVWSEVNFERKEWIFDFDSYLLKGKSEYAFIFLKIFDM